MNSKQRKIFGGDPAFIGIILLIALSVVAQLAPPQPNLSITGSTSAPVVYRGR